MRNDNDIIEALKKGARDAQEELVMRYMQRICNFIATIVPNRQDAEELTQDTFLALFANAHRYDIQQNTLASLMYRIAYNKAHNFLRRSRIKTVPIDEATVDSLVSQEDYSDAEFVDIKEQRRLELERLMKALSQREQAIMMLYYYEGRKVADIAYILDTTPKAVYNRLYRIRKELQIQVSKNQQSQ